MKTRSSFRVVTYLVLLFVIFPIVVLLGTAVTASSYVSFPPEGFSLKWIIGLASDTEFLRSLVTSLWLASLTSIICVGLSIGTVLYLERSGTRFKALAETIIMAPGLVPSLVLGIGLLFLLSQLNLVGSPAALLGAHVVLSFPFALRAVTAGVKGLDISLERAAAILGAPPSRVLRVVTLPMLKPGIVAATLFSFLISFNNITVTVFIARADVQTLPVVLFRRSQDIIEPSVAAIAVFVLVTTTAVLTIIQKRFGVFDNLRPQSAGR